jgi:hypothetical protein
VYVRIIPGTDGLLRVTGMPLLSDGYAIISVRSAGIKRFDERLARLLPIMICAAQREGKQLWKR